MHSTSTLRLFGACTLVAFSACAGPISSDPAGPGVEISIAPLTLEGATRVCYHLQVKNGAAVVWERADLCSDAYGNGAGGAITYVGTCDASAATNTVSLELEDIYALDASQQEVALSDVTDYVNPCPDLVTCQQTVSCDKNADTFVQFNLTMMRNARQGFFDIAVNFQDIFCSAKFDTCYSTPGEGGDIVSIEGPSIPYRASAPDGRIIYAEVSYNSFNPSASKYSAYIYDDGSGFAPASPGASMWHQVAGMAITESPGADTLNSPSTQLHATNADGVAILLTLATSDAPTFTPIKLLSGASGRRTTAIAALACSAGADTGASGTGDISTQLLLTKPEIVCGVQKRTDATLIELPIYGLGAGNQTVAIDETHDLHYALYFGAEELACELGAGSCNKVYYNIAIDMEDLAAAGLTGCHFSMSASATDGAFTGFDATGKTLAGTTSYPIVTYDVEFATNECTINPLNGGDGGVYTDYAADMTFDYHTGGTAAASFAP